MLGKVTFKDYSNPYGEAITENKRLLQRERTPETLNLLVASLMLDGKHDEARGWLEQSFAEFPINPVAKYVKGLMLLNEGDYAEGFKLYEYRFAAYPDNAKIDRMMAKWHGEQTDNVVYIWHDGGVGDAIMFMRYFPEVIRRAPNAKFLVNPYLIDLFAFNGIPHDKLPKDRDKFDWCFDGKLGCSLQSLPATLGVTQISGEPYLQAFAPLAESWRVKLLLKPKIGFCWKGNPAHERDATRSIPDKAAFAFCERHELFSLQGEHLHSKEWTETAAIVANMDLIISCDTSIVHLAGAMGKPTWILLPVDFDWRWQRTGTRSPWYDSVRLFRCQQHGAWDNLLTQVSVELDASR